MYETICPFSFTLLYQTLSDKLCFTSAPYQNDLNLQIIKNACQNDEVIVLSVILCLENRNL